MKVVSEFYCEGRVSEPVYFECLLFLTGQGCTPLAPLHVFHYLIHCDQNKCPRRNPATRGIAGNCREYVKTTSLIDAGRPQARIANTSYTTRIVSTMTRSVAVICGGAIDSTRKR